MGWRKELGLWRGRLELDLKDKDVEEDVALGWLPTRMLPGLPWPAEGAQGLASWDLGVCGKIWTAFASLGPCGSLTHTESQIFCNKGVLTPTSQYG